jgi:DNA-binding LytR/AlgR family response regulator
MSKELLLFNSRDELLRLDISKIVYFVADGNYTNVMLLNKLKCSVGMNLGQMEKVLTDRLQEKSKIFVRIGKSYVINMNYIFQIQVPRKRLLLTDYDGCIYSLEMSKEALKKLKEIVVMIKI